MTTDRPVDLAELARRIGELDGHLMRAATADEARADSIVAHYRLLVAEAPDVLAELPADAFTVTGWRFAARIAEVDAGDQVLAVEYRRRALQAAGVDPDLDPGSFGYLDVIHPRHVEEVGPDTVVRCMIPTTRDGAPCSWRSARPTGAMPSAGEKYAAHVLHDHSTTVTTAGDAF